MRNSKVILCLVGFLVGMVGGACVHRAQEPPALGATWVELGPEGRSQVRVETRTFDCPRLESDRGALPMRVRAKASSGFESTTCEAEIAPNVKSVSIDGKPLPLPKPEIQRLVILGDTGCRVVPGRYQNCDSPEKWPFARIAKLAADLKPDLVIHVGDYLYREGVCPAGKACAGPSGDREETWYADFFRPAEPLLEAAPWVFVRGNHESCDRAFHGWRRFLAPFPYAEAEPCARFEPPYVVPLAAMQLAVFDVTEAQDQKAPANIVDLFKKQWDEIRARHLREGWILTHRPLYGVAKLKGLKLGGGLVPTNQALEKAFGKAEGMKVVFSGHIHDFEALNFADHRPPQVIVGNSGTQLESTVPTTLDGLHYFGTLTEDTTVLGDFGFLSLDRESARVWSGKLWDQQGQVQFECRFDGTEFRCEKPHAGAMPQG